MCNSDISTDSSIYRARRSKVRERGEKEIKMARRETTIVEVKKNSPEFNNHQYYFTSQKTNLRSPVLQNGCIVNPGTCKTLGEVTDVLASKVPEDKEKKKELVNDLQDFHCSSYNKDKNQERRPVLKGSCPFAFTTKEGKPVIEPPSAIGSVYVTKTEIERKCPTFKNGACSHKLKELSALTENCPQFKDGKCPFSKLKDVGEMKEMLGRMRDQHQTKKAKENAHQAIKIIHKVNVSEAEKYGHCTFFQYGCHFATDLNNKPIEN